MASGIQYDTHKPNELRRLYEPLGVLHELTTKSATKPRSIVSTRSQAISITQRRRDFVDAIAFLGAYEKETEIAVAVEQRPDGLIVRVAGTGDIDGIVVPFLNELLVLLSTTLRRLKDEINGDGKEVACDFLADTALDFASKKVYAHYMKLLHHIAPVCFADMEMGPTDANTGSLNFKTWFQENFYKNGAPLLQEHMKLLAKECFKARQSRLLNPLRNLTYQGHEHVTYFEKFHKQLRKLSLTMDMTSELLESAISLRQDLADGLIAQSIPSSPRLPIPLLQRKLTMEGIANRISSDSSKRDDFLRKLQLTAPPGLIQALSDNSQKVFTEVHPELLVINYFDALSDGGFIDERDKYIGCTKPSCYLCHLFISYHPARYSMIRSNSRVCLNWRLPDICLREGNALARAKDQKSILRKLIDTIRTDLEEKVNNDWISQSHCTESETEWAPAIEDDTINSSSPLSNPESTSGCPAASTDIPILELNTTSEEASGSSNSSDEDAGGVVLFKGRCRF